MSPFLSDVFNNHGFTLESGEFVEYHSETSREQCEFIQGIINKYSLSSTIEIGFAYGLSALAIMEAVSGKGIRHVVIDKFEISDWKGYGLALVEKAGYLSQLEFHEDYCYNVLPSLLKDGRKFDFAYIDSTKQFDWLLVNFFYLDKMLSIGGIIVFDDTDFPGIRKLLRLIAGYPSYRIIAKYPERLAKSRKQKLMSLASLIPFSSKLLKPSLTNVDDRLGINARAVAIQKISDDNRNWNWFHDF